MSEPRPWEQAKDGEVWVIDFKHKVFGDELFPTIATESSDGVTRFNFGGLAVPVDASMFIGGRRIWPEPETV